MHKERDRAPVVGTAALVQHFTSFFAKPQRWELQVDDVLEQGNRTAVFYRFCIEGADGAWHERAGCAEVVMRDGRIELWREYAG